MKSKTKNLVFLLVMGLIFPLIINFSFNFNHNYQHNINKPKISATYTNVLIDDLATGPGAHNWTWARTQPWCTGGNGTQENPYIIEDSIFLPSGSSDCFTVANSTQYFVVENCTFKDTPVNGYTGIRLKNVINAFIIDNQVYNNSHGIYCLNVNDSRIIDNNCSDNAFYGIYLPNCYNNNITGNTANDNNYGIYLEYECDYNTISGNTANGNNQYGIYIYQSDNNTISGNTINDNGDSGLLVGLLCNNNNISGNILNNNDYNGIFIVEKCMNNTILGNTINDNGDSGIILEYLCNKNIISGNSVNNNTADGIYLEDCDNNTIKGNTVNGNGDGMNIHWSNNNTVSGNTVNNNDDGMFLHFSDNNTVSGNTVNSNDDGIYIYYCDYNNITGNTACNNTLNGIYLDVTLNNTIKGNTVCDNIGMGINTGEGSYYNEVTENIIYNNTIGIFFDENDDNNLVYKNFFLKNGKHAIDDGTDNKWNSTTIGNYWDNHTGPDDELPYGIVDTQYNISGTGWGIDYLPIAEDGAPQITINSPSEGDAFSSGAPNFNVEITDDYLDTMWYTLDGGSNNYTFTENGMINQTAWDGMDDGAITLTFYARDIPRYIGFAEVDIIKDTVTPVIIINAPTEGERFGRNAPLFNITVTDDNLDATWYSFDGGAHIYVITNNTVFNQTVWAVLVQGNVTITFYARDLAGNEASESVTVIKSVPSGLDPGMIITIVIVSVVGGVAVISVVYIFMKKRATPA